MKNFTLVADFYEGLEDFQLIDIINASNDLTEIRFAAQELYTRYEIKQMERMFN